ncbi:uncharacterized protein LOC117584267 [Drosophila guanche]|uniref:uncharacterized protein LOC117584267 n=1 Tax=Drosophila guanche TaxID=7266 RepID=UPI00147120A4|nr:uncharacterized protein LOC117584267 [Drosophila guanche]
MEATQVLLLLLSLATILWVPISGCSQACHPFTGLNACRDPGITEPKLPPRDNACCGPHCVYTSPNREGTCSNTKTNRCLLDTSCSNGLAFNFVCISGCELQTVNEGRIKKGFAPLLPFNYKKTVCNELNKKCGINCCCREFCPKKFCKF